MNLNKSESKISMSAIFGNFSFLAYSGQREEILKIREF